MSVGKWDTERQGVSYHIDYDKESGEILTSCDMHGNEIFDRMYDSIADEFTDWFVTRQEAARDSARGV